MGDASSRIGYFHLKLFRFRISSTRRVLRGRGVVGRVGEGEWGDVGGQEMERLTRRDGEHEARLTRRRIKGPEI